MTDEPKTRPRKDADGAPIGTPDGGPNGGPNGGPDSALDGTPDGGTLASTAYQRLRADILTGQLPPGEKLRVAHLRDVYDVGNSPLREALNRLSMDGLVDRFDQRGFRVASVSRQELEELVRTRCWLEGLALRESIANRTDAWEEGIVLAFHRLSKVPRSTSQEVFTTNHQWEQLHRNFHGALIANCGSTLLQQFCVQLADKADRYRQLAVATSYPKRNEKDEHRTIMEATIDGRIDDAEAALLSHFHKTSDIILESELPLPA